MLRLTHEAAADGCVSAEIENFLFSIFCTAHFCQSCMCQTQRECISLKARPNVSEQFIHKYNERF